uniref:Craniofacial development protein 2like [Aplysia californica] n=1 Tax=Lepeophtheirus salmonis TaxID=72036 RepID=A0A0K2TB47_LEPSM
MFQSDKIEERFGWYRQLSGANYYISVRQILEAGKKIRIKSLVKFNDITISEVKDVLAYPSIQIGSLQILRQCPLYQKAMYCFLLWDKLHFLSRRKSNVRHTDHFWLLTILQLTLALSLWWNPMKTD